MILSELQADTLKEVVNLGVGYAAGSLNELVGAHVSLHVPEIAMLSLEEARNRVDALGWGVLSSVQLQFSGPLKGQVALIFPSTSAVKLVSLLTGDEGGDSDVNGVRAATLVEAGNILLNGVVGSISNLVQQHTFFSVPHYSEERGLPVGLARRCDPFGVHVIFARTGFEMAQHQIEGEILLFFEIGALEALIAALDRYMAQPA